VFSQFLFLFFATGCYLFILRERRNKTTAAENGKIILYRIKSVISTRFPDLLPGFKLLKDSRNRKEYSMEELISGALLMLIFKQTSRNSFNNKRGDIIFAKNYYRHFKLRLSHPDAIDQMMYEMPPELLEELKTQLVAGLFEQNCFESSKRLTTNRIILELKFVNCSRYLILLKIDSFSFADPKKISQFCTPTSSYRWA